MTEIREGFAQPNPALLGIILNRVKRASEHAYRDTELREAYGELVFAGGIPERIAVADAASSGRPRPRPTRGRCLGRVQRPQRHLDPATATNHHHRDGPPVVNSQPTRRPSITRPAHPARAAAEAARNAEPNPETRGETDAAPTIPDTGRAATEGTQRLRDGRVSYAGKAGTVYFPSAQDRQRAKYAFLAHGGIEGYTSETEWWTDVILNAVEEWEQAYNGGQPFEVQARSSRRPRR